MMFFTISYLKLKTLFMLNNLITRLTNENDFGSKSLSFRCAIKIEVVTKLICTITYLVRFSFPTRDLILL